MRRRHAATLLLALWLADPVRGQEHETLPPLRIVPITDGQAADILASLRDDFPPVQLPWPVVDMQSAFRAVDTALNYVPPKRVARSGDWFFFPRLDQAGDDGTFRSGFAVRNGGDQLQFWTNPATEIVRWTFEPPVADLGSPAPATGHGTALLFGGTGGGLGSGAASGSRGAWNTSGYPPQGTASGTRGVRFDVSTAGHSNIVVHFDHRASRTASRWARLDITTDGRTFQPLWTNNGALSPPDQLRNVRLDLRLVPGANNNPLFGFRVVSVFSPVAFRENAKSAEFPGDSAYMRASEEAAFTPDAATGKGSYGMDGTWRFDNVTVTGVALDEWTRRLPMIEAALYVVALLVAAALAVFTRKVLPASAILFGMLAATFAAIRFGLPWTHYLQTTDPAALVDQPSPAATARFLLLAAAGTSAFAAAAALGLRLGARPGRRPRAGEG
jgi:hypothetical protein